MKTLSLLFLATFSLSVFAQPPISWKRSYPMPGNQQATSADTTADDGFIVSGIDDAHPSLLRVNANGDTLWTKTFTNYYGGFEEVKQSFDKGFAAIQTLQSHLSVTKTDSFGEIEWIYNDPDTLTSHGRAISLTDDGGYIAVGDIFYGGQSPYTCVYYIKVDSAGQRVWGHYVGSVYDDDGGYDISPVSNDSYLLIGGISCSQWHPGGWLRRINASGSPSWTRLYCDQDGYEVGYAGCELIDGSCVLAGYKHWYTGSRLKDFFVWRVRSTGATVWSWSNGGSSNDHAFGILPTSTGGAIVVGERDVAQYGGGRRDAWIVGIDSAGASDWDIILGNDGYDAASDIIQTKDGGSLIVGYTNHGIRNEIDYWLIKLCPEGSDAAHPVFAYANDGYLGFRLEHEAGEIDTLIFASVPVGVIGTITGEASLTWQVLPNGDGNNGDSIIFVTSMPLIAGSIDTFWLSHFLGDTILQFEAGCRTDTLSPSFCCVDSIQFSGGVMDGFVEFHLSVFGMHNLDALDIMRAGYSSDWVLAESIPITEDTAFAEYLVRDYGPWALKYMVVGRDLIGLTHNFQDQMLIRGQNLGALEVVSSIPQHYSLRICPNPFNPSTTLEFSLAKSERVTMDVFDLQGRLARAVLAEVRETGVHRVPFDGSGLPSGIYFARMTTPTHVQTQKIVLLR